LRLTSRFVAAEYLFPESWFLLKLHESPKRSVLTHPVPVLAKALKARCLTKTCCKVPSHSFKPIPESCIWSHCQLKSSTLFFRKLRHHEERGEVKETWVEFGGFLGSLKKEIVWHRLLSTCWRI